jgi:hypothetical protein
VNKDNNNEITLVDVFVKLRATLKFLWSKKTSIIIASVIGGIIGLTYSLVKPIEHQAKLTFIVDQDGGMSSLSALSGIASSIGLGELGGSGGGGGLYDNQANLMNYLKSRSIIETAYLSLIPGTKTTFAERFADKYDWKEDWREDAILKSINFRSPKPRDAFTLQEDSVLFEMYKFTLEKGLLSVGLTDEEGSIITISYTTVDDTLSKFFPEVLLNIVSENYIKAKTKQARENVQILQHQTDSVRVTLNKALFNAASETDQVFGLNPALNVRRVPATKEQIDIKASSVLLEELIKNLELAKVQLKEETPLIELIDNPRFPLEEIKKGKIMSLLIGGVVASFLYVFYVLTLRFFRKIYVESSEKEIESISNMP